MVRAAIVAIVVIIATKYERDSSIIRSSKHSRSSTTIMEVVAVLEIHIDRKAVGIMKLSISSRGLVPEIIMQLFLLLLLIVLLLLLLLIL